MAKTSRKKKSITVAAATVKNASVTAMDATPTFDPIAWALEGFEGDLPAATIVERRIGYPSASVTLDRSAPIGDVVINENPTAGGVRVHTLQAFSESAELAGTLFVVDPLGDVVRRSEVLGGSEDPEQFEVIGSGSARSIVLRLQRGTDGYPAVKKIVVGATANSPRQVLLEARKLPGHPWAPLAVAMVEERTRKFAKFTLKSQISVAEVRLRYCGDYFAASEEGTITITASDSISGVDAVQISRYADFRDAADFEGADARGWIPFSDGITVYETSLLNSDRLWTAVRGTLDSEPKFAANYGSSLLVATRQNLYSVLPDGDLEHLYDAGEDITALAVHKGQVFVSTGDGQIRRSKNGAVFTVTNPFTDLGAVSTMTSFQNRLYAGSDDIWVFDGAQWTKSTTVVDASVRSLQAVGTRLYAGVGGDIGRKKGRVLAYDGMAWETTRETGEDVVSTLGVGGGMLWAGTASGIVHTAELNGDGSVKFWDVPPQAGEASPLSQIRGSRDGRYVWFLTSDGSYLYDTADQTYTVLTEPLQYPHGLNARYQETTEEDVKELASGSGDVQTSVVATVSMVDLLESSSLALSGTAFNATFTGFVKADRTAEHTFHLTTGPSMGARLYVGGKPDGLLWSGGDKLIDTWDAPDEKTSGKITLTAGQWVPLRLEVWHLEPSSPLVLEWSCEGIKKEVVPSYDLAVSRTGTQTALVSSAELGDLYAFSCLDGRIRTLDADFLTSKRRNIYAKFRDKAGNVGAYVLDDIMRGSQSTDEDASPTNGRILQVGESKTLLHTFTSPSSGSLLAPSREVRVVGVYESIPYHVSTLTRWDQISTIVTIPSTGTPPEGIEGGVSVDLYVRTADTESALMEEDWGVPFSISSIPPSSTTGAGISQSFNIAPRKGKYLQFRMVLTSAAKNITPSVASVAVSYMAAEGSFFFSKVFRLSDFTEALPTPVFRRGVLTANTMPNGGIIKFGISTETDGVGAFDYGRYQEVPLNEVFEFPPGKTEFMLGLILVSVSEENPAVVDEWGLQLEAGKADIKFMSGA
jgi:hypothetical protein